MKVSLKPVSDQVIVITGASSGIGLATAEAAAAQGARLVLAARNGRALKEITDGIVARGGDAVFVAADVGSQDDVRRIANAAISSFGGFDTWINDAGTGIFGKLADVSDDDNRRLFDTNFWGVVYGSLAAADHLREKGGAIINIGSIASDQPTAGLGIYTASKHAVKGFTEVLRLELAQEASPISLTLVKPAAVATPFFEHARDYSGESRETPHPLYDPRDVAKAVLHAAAHPVKTLSIGAAGRIAGGLSAYAPRLMNWLSGAGARREEDAALSTGNDNLHAPAVDGNVHGAAANEGRASLYAGARRHSVAAGLTLAAVAGVLSAYALNARGKSTGRKIRRFFTRAA